MTRVHIELQRLQTWLFTVPRLRAMVGANTLLGEVLRVKLPELARKNEEKWLLAPSAEAYPSADQHDPLKQHDDPLNDARVGILARDGGHFEAQFVKGAEAFATVARQLLHRELPGLRFRISIDGVEYDQSHVQLPTELPVLAPCEWTGRSLASKIIEQGDERHLVSRDVARRHEAAKRAEDGAAKDLATLLSMRTKLNSLERPQELKDLVGSGYLGLIYADGNGVGAGVGTTDSERAAFFHRNRVLLRRALRKAIDVHCPDSGQAPLILLMLGGDDLLLVCRADMALPFVVTLCEELAGLQREHINNGFELTLGVGVVVAKHTIPIYRLHEIAEQLASSAKRRFRALRDAGKKAGSVVDWAVYTTAWVDDPEEFRRRHWLRGQGQDRRVLSQRPVDVLGDGLHTLQGLVEGAKKLQGAPRSQLRYLIDQLARGRTLTELAFAELSKEARTALDEVGVKAPWRRASNNGLWLTELLDLVEIAEIGRLGRNVEAGQPATEAAHG
ncbi:MAG TPA: hypothetical protein VNL72_03530 [Gammaproteobacteria bacterium]|nr:hypothetical protein [Gammaproteobacteria bacterium]